ncbi:MAG TPA: hypothetical protein VMN60_12255 [Longimicrobiales bacterium]|nr:hypothetical protein [Longimicrobiales bacterium]
MNFREPQVAVRLMLRVITIALILGAGCYKGEHSRNGTDTSAEPYCQISIGSPVALHTNAGKEVLVDASVTASSGGDLAIFGLPTIVWRDSVGTSADELNTAIGALAERSGRVEFIAHPQPRAELHVVHAMQDGEDWLVFWIERGMDLVPGFGTVKSLWEGRWNGDWQSITRIETTWPEAALALHGSLVIRSRTGQVHWVFQSGRRSEGQSVGAPSGLVILRGDSARWDTQWIDFAHIQHVRHVRTELGADMLFLAHAAREDDRFVRVLSAFPLENPAAARVWWRLGASNIGNLWVHAVDGGIQASWLLAEAAGADMRTVLLEQPLLATGPAFSVMKVAQDADVSLMQMQNGAFLVAALDRNSHAVARIVAVDGKLSRTSCSTDVAGALTGGFLHLLPDSAHAWLVAPVLRSGRPTTALMRGIIFLKS